MSGTVVVNTTHTSTATTPVEAAKRRRRIPAPAIAGGTIVALLLLIAILAPVLAPHGPLEGNITDRLLPVGSPGHILGTDTQGRDILSRLMYGARPSLFSGILPVLVAGIIGTTLGVIGGLSGRWTNGTIMRVLDIFYAFPGVLLAIMINSAMGSGVSNAILALSVVMVPPIARIANTEVARMRNSDYMETARASGASMLSIAVRQVLPTIAPAILVYCTALVGLAIVFAAGLSFIGLGVAPPNPEWGQMLNDLRQNLFDAPVLAMIPAVQVFIASLGFNLLGDGLRDILDVRGAGRS